MSRRDIIIIAVLTNIGLLAVLFMMAINTEDETRDTPLVEEVHVVQPEAGMEIKAGDKDKVVLAQHNEADEVDTLLKDFAESNSIESEKIKDSLLVEPEFLNKGVEDEVMSDKPAPTKTQGNEQYIEVTVKKGDVLSKIAKANGTTVQKIKKLNNLTSDQLKVGQTLKIPHEGKSSSLPVRQDTKSSDLVAGGTSDYYVIQTGDNPWKIAKKFNISVGDFLKMNNMDEKKAKNLKVGQRVRVK
ncbi:muramidase family protein [Estrella lausannensis]|uniref:Putative muramidase n=1 Tax=Estrella lausannensis TaxID=483423 RepID=A0A0H5DTV0_9BACT|nr:LysM peptidoglycan-binding domain-containing protein [Estrella lausannensis]CRX39314.1 Putative muramidase [Estrella lausannensis]